MLSIAALVVPVFMGIPVAEAATASPMKFGMEAAAVGPLTDLGIKPDYAMMWVGPWTQKSGWGGTDATLDRLYAAGVTPSIQFYYWGDDISKSCLENGCWSDLHQAWKDKTGWQRLAEDLGKHLNDHMKGRAVVIVLESEFNKNDAGAYEALDGYLSSKAGYLKWAYPSAQVVLGFGNWGQSNWGVFDRAAGTANLVGVQAMRASTRDTLDSYRNLVPGLLESVKKLKSLFGKDVLITDLALSSHSEPTWLSHQRDAIQAFMDRRAEFRAAGAVGVVYRSLYDNPNADINNYYGEAERHFGLVWSANKTWKPAMKVWSDGIKAERAAPQLIEAEQFAQKTTGGRVASTFASGGAYWNLWSNGYVAHTVAATSGTYEIRLRATGTLHDGVAPLAKIVVDGKELWRDRVAAGGYHDYVARAPLSDGVHSVQVHFLNDASGNGQDRNLHVDCVTVVKVW